MFEFLFGWRKASRCKRLIRRVQCRLKLLKNKRDSIIRQLQQDVVHLIKNGHEQCAFDRIEQLNKDQSLITIYDMLYNFSEFIIINLSYIRRHRDCPNDINEAVSSLLYASARFGDLPELIKLRKLFGERYGQKFAITAVELLHGNLVNPQISENLCMKPIPDDLKINLMKEIARDNGLQVHYIEIDGKFELRHSPDLCKENYRIEWIEHRSEGDDQCANDVSVTAAADHILESSTDIVKEEEMILATSSCTSIEVEKIMATASDSPSHGSERSIIYLDDVEEIQPSITEDKDQRLFVFKSNTTPVVQKDRAGAGITIDLSSIYPDQIDPSDGKSSSRSGSKRRTPSRKRYKRVENLSMKDIECALYYGEPGYSSQEDDTLSLKSQPQRKHQRKISDAESMTSSATNYRKKLTTSSPKSPFFATTDDKDDPPTVRGGNPNCKITNKQMEEAEVIDSRHSYTSSLDSGSRLVSPWTNTRPPYLRALTMPSQRPKESTPSYQGLKQRLSNIGSPSYVHPKLPDYDDLAAKFKALRSGQFAK